MVWGLNSGHQEKKIIYSLNKQINITFKSEKKITKFKCDNYNKNDNICSYDTL